MTRAKNIAIIGSKGKMGSALGVLWEKAGYAVNGVDRRQNASAGSDCGLDTHELKNAVTRAAAVVICVPVTVLRDIIACVTPFLRAGQILMDITSVKILPMLWMEEFYPGPVVGAHPLFGPNPAPEHLRVPLVRGRNTTDKDAALAEALFRDIDCTTFWTTAEGHDTGVALAQSLNFTLSAAFFALLAENSHSRPFFTPSFTRHLESARKHLTVDTAMFCEFTAQNPMFPAALQQYRAMIDRVEQGELASVAEEAAIWYGQKG